MFRSGMWCQRQVQLTGPDAAVLVQLMTPRDLRGIRVGQGLNLPLIDEHAGMLNDPVVLKLSDQKFWLSIADSDVLLFAKGIAFGRGLDVVVEEPDVFPLAVQGPKAEPLMTKLFGPAITELPYFGFASFDVLGTAQVIARSGYSKQGGFEIYLEGGIWGALSGILSGRPVRISTFVPDARTSSNGSRAGCCPMAMNSPAPTIRWNAALSGFVTLVTTSNISGVRHF